MSAPDYSTFQHAASSRSEVNQLRFLLRRTLASLRTMTLCQVVSVTNSGGVTAVGLVDLQPLVQQTDGLGNVIDLPVLYNVPYSRLQGGKNAVILDPEVGDIGLAGFSDRDISAVVSRQSNSPPGSNRRHSLADALYLGAYLNKTPAQYVRFSAAGIELVSPTKITINAPLTEFPNPVKFGSTATNAAGIELGAHHHTAQGATAPTTSAQP